MCIRIYILSTNVNDMLGNIDIKGYHITSRIFLRFQPADVMSWLFCIENFPHSMNFWFMLGCLCGGLNEVHCILVHWGSNSFLTPFGMPK